MVNQALVMRVGPPLGSTSLRIIQCTLLLDKGLLRLMGIRIKVIRELFKRLLWRFMNRSSRFWMRYQIRNLWLSRDKVSEKKGEVKAEIQWLIKPVANALKDKVPTPLQGQTECLNYNLRLEVKTLRDQPSWTFKAKNLKNMDWPIKKSLVSLVMRK